MSTDSPPTISIDGTRLLWRTRGWRWDYMFLLRPDVAGMTGWLSLFEHVFGREQAEEANRYRRGAIRVAGYAPPLRYVAAVLIDPERTDFAGRPTRHYLVYLPADDSELAGFTDGWAEALLQALAPALGDVFTLEKSATEGSQEFSERLLRSLRATAPAEITVPVVEREAAWKELPDFALDDAQKKTVGSASRKPGPNSDTVRIAMWFVAAALLLLLAMRMC